MASTPYDDLSDEWDAAKRYTASADIDINLANPSDSFLFWAITDDDTPPTIALRRSNPVGPKTSQPMALTSGERVWLGGDGAFANLET